MKLTVGGRLQTVHVPLLSLLAALRDPSADVRTKYINLGCHGKRANEVCINFQHMHTKTPFWNGDVHQNLTADNSSIISAWNKGTKYSARCDKMSMDVDVYQTCCAHNTAVTHMAVLLTKNTEHQLLQNFQKLSSSGGDAHGSFRHMIRDTGL
ncbi:MAG: hypothetical protein JSS82_15745 [Bacteroidetes bacterium]|nr:hypothetical protein [Bacteroidota bacterium]